MRILREIMRWIVFIGVVIVLTFTINTYVGQRTQVKGHSMEPALQYYDNLIVDRLSYHFRTPERFEIIVFPFNEDEDMFYIKRIIGLPGETVQIIDGEIFINGVILNSDKFGKELISEPGIARQPIHLGHEEYFVLGDNRNNSRDSRDPSVGVRHRDDFIGRAWIRIWPLSGFGFVDHE